jgi:hypothetical protein
MRGRAETTYQPVKIRRVPAGQVQRESFSPAAAGRVERIISRVANPIKPMWSSRGTTIVRGILRYPFESS